MIMQRREFNTIAALITGAASLGIAPAIASPAPTFAAHMPGEDWEDWEVWKEFNQTAKVKFDELLHVFSPEDDLLITAQSAVFEWRRPVVVYRHRSKDVLATHQNGPDRSHLVLRDVRTSDRDLMLLSTNGNTPRELTCQAVNPASTCRHMLTMEKMLLGTVSTRTLSDSVSQWEIGEVTFTGLGKFTVHDSRHKDGHFPFGREWAPEKGVRRNYSFTAGRIPFKEGQA